MEIVWVIIAVIGLPALLIIGAGTSAILGMGSPKADIVPIEPGPASPEVVRTRHVNDWAVREGFEWVGMYETRFPRSMRSVIGAWQSPDGTFLVFYMVNDKVYQELVSSFENANDLGLTTSNSPDSMTFPMPRTWLIQSFPKTDLDQLLARHETSMQLVESVTRVAPNVPDEPLERLILEAVKKQTEHIRSFPLWPLMILWWFCTKSLRTGKPVTEQRVRDASQHSTMP